MKRLGRPRTLTKRSMRYVARLVGQNRTQSAAQLANAVSETTGSSVSAATIRRTLHDGNLHGRRSRRKPFLEPKHKQGRLQFANDHKDKPMSFWNSVLWSDETKINLFGSDAARYVWHRPREEYKDIFLVPTVRHGGGSLMVWSCMSARGVSEIHFIDSIMNAGVYCNILKEKMIPSLKHLGRGAIFQQDNDPKHSAKVTSVFLKRKVKVFNSLACPQIWTQSNICGTYLNVK